MVEAAWELAGDDLRFFADIDTAREWLGGIDLVHASGLIQYTPSPETVLASLLAIGAPCVAIFRCALSWGERKIIVESRLLSQMLISDIPASSKDHEVRYPCTFMATDDFISAILAAHRLHSCSLDFREAPKVADGAVLKSGDNFCWSANKFVSAKLIQIICRFVGTVA